MVKKRLSNGRKQALTRMDSFFNKHRLCVPSYEYYILLRKKWRISNYYYSYIQTQNKCNITDLMKITNALIDLIPIVSSQLLFEFNTSCVFTTVI